MLPGGDVWAGGIQRGGIDGGRKRGTARIEVGCGKRRGRKHHATATAAAGDRRQMSASARLRPALAVTWLERRRAGAFACVCVRALGARGCTVHTTRMDAGDERRDPWRNAARGFRRPEEKSRQGVYVLRVRRAGEPLGQRGEATALVVRVCGGCAQHQAADRQPDEAPATVRAGASQPAAPAAPTTTGRRPRRAAALRTARDETRGLSAVLAVAGGGGLVGGCGHCLEGERVGGAGDVGCAALLLSLLGVLRSFLLVQRRDSSRAPARWHRRRRAATDAHAGGVLM